MLATHRPHPNPATRLLLRYFLSHVCQIYRVKVFTVYLSQSLYFTSDGSGRSPRRFVQFTFSYVDSLGKGPLLTPIKTIYKIIAFRILIVRF